MGKTVSRLSLAHLSRQAHKVSLYSCSGVRCRRCGQQCSNIFSETAGPIEAKFVLDSPWEGIMKFYINGPGP